MQQIFVFLPAFFTNLLVLDAMPEIWERKFRATLSPINILLISPSITAITDPLLIFDPSFFFTWNLMFLSNKLNVCLANSNPPIIPFSLLIRLAFEIELLFNRLVVISPEGYRSSLRATYRLIG